MTSNEKTQNYKVVDLVEGYNFYTKFISIPSSYEKVIISLRSDLVTLAGWHDKTVLSHRREWRDKLNMWNMCWQTPSMPTWHTLSRQFMWQDRVFL